MAEKHSCLQNASGADPLGALRVYRERVRAALKQRSRAETATER